jgi:histone-lysine N-methyltransferase SETMAR
MTLKELQRVISPNSGTVIHLKQCLRGRHPRLFQGRGKQLVRKIMITIFFTACQLILLDVLPKGSKFNQQYFIDHVFPDLKMENRNFGRRMPLATFWVHMDNSMCYNGSKVVSKFDKHHIARLPHPPYSPDLSPCNFWLFWMLKGILKDEEFHSHDEIEEAITMAWNDLTFDEGQSVFHNWMNRLRRVIENGGQYITE